MNGKGRDTRGQSPVASYIYPAFTNPTLNVMKALKTKHMIGLTAIPMD